MAKVKVREFMKFSPIQLRDGLKTNLDVIFEDNIVRNVPSRVMIVNRYIWQLLENINLPIVSDYSVDTAFIKGSFVSNTINNIFARIYKDYINKYCEPYNKRDGISDLWLRMTEIHSQLYNEIVYKSLDYITSLPIESFLDIQLDPRLIEAMRKVQNSLEDDAVTITKKISECYDVLHEVLTDPKYKDNLVAIGYMSSTFRANQIRQVLSVRGFISTLHNLIYKYPIASSFTSGLYSITELAMETRTGAKALMNQLGAVAESEYTARTLQLKVMNVETIHDGDCGSKEYLEWSIPDGSDPSVPDKFNLLEGKYYLNEETGREEPITSELKSKLIGKTIKIRSVLKCQHPDKHGVCTKCFGLLSYNIPKHANVGCYSVAVMSQQATQSILSTKHEMSSSTSIEIMFEGAAKNNFTTKGTDSNLVYLKKSSKDEYSGDLEYDNKNFKVDIAITTSSGFGIQDIGPDTDVSKYIPNQVTKLYDIWLIKTDLETGDVIEEPIRIMKGRFVGSLTTEALNYIKNNGYTLDNDDRIIVNLDKWKYSEPIIILPDVEFSYMTYIKKLRRLFGTAVTNIEIDDLGISKQEGLLYRLFNEVNSKLSVNIAFLETMVYACSVRDYDNGDYRMARGCKNPTVLGIRDVMFKSSLGVTYAWEWHKKTMTDIKAYKTEGSRQHMLDVMLCPNETINEFRKKGRLYRS